MLQKKIESLADNASLFRATDLNVLDLILKDRFKSQFETGTSHGSLSHSGRAGAEEAYFGYGASSPDAIKHDRENRPIYGYCSDNENGVQTGDGKHPPPNAASSYGRVTVKFKDELKNRATFCFTDSLGASSSVACVPMNHPHFTAFSMYSDPLESVTRLDSFGSYVEVQYHKQVKHTDIESIHLSAGNFGGLDYSGAYESVNQANDIARKHE